MKSSTLPQYTSNPSLVIKNKKQHLYDEDTTISAYSLPYKSNKLHHTKSHNDLYQGNPSLSLSPQIKTNNDDNKTKLREIYSSHSATTTTTSLRIQPTTTTINCSNVTQSSPSNKIPLWKRFKKMIVSTKRNKDRQQSSKIPTLLFNELSDKQSGKQSL